MTVCEVCGTQVRRREFNGEFQKMICWRCSIDLNLMRNCPQDLLKHKRKLEGRIEELQKKQITTVKSKLTFSNCFSAVPPNGVIANALLALEVSDKYSAFSTVLADYYGVSAPPYLVNDEKVPEDAIACYYGPPTNIVYTRKKGEFSHRTAFHEFYHALQHQGAVPNPVERVEREKEAEWFASACVKVEEKTT